MYRYLFDECYPNRKDKISNDIHPSHLNTQMRQNKFSTQRRRHDVYLFLSINAFIVTSHSYITQKKKTRCKIQHDIHLEYFQFSGQMLFFCFNRISFANNEPIARLLFMNSIYWKTITRKES